MLNHVTCLRLLAVYAHYIGLRDHIYWIYVIICIIHDYSASQIGTLWNIHGWPKCPFHLQVFNHNSYLKFNCALIWSLMNWSLQIYAHATTAAVVSCAKICSNIVTMNGVTTAQLSCHVHKFVVISPWMKLQWNKIVVEFYIPMEKAPISHTSFHV